MTRQEYAILQVRILAERLVVLTRAPALQDEAWKGDVEEAVFDLDAAWWAPVAVVPLAYQTVDFAQLTERMNRDGARVPDVAQTTFLE